MSNHVTLKREKSTKTHEGSHWGMLDLYLTRVFKKMQVLTIYFLIMDPFESVYVCPLVLSPLPQWYMCLWNDTPNVPSGMQNKSISNITWLCFFFWSIGFWIWNFTLLSALYIYMLETGWTSKVSYWSPLILFWIWNFTLLSQTHISFFVFFNFCSLKWFNLDYTSHFYSIYNKINQVIKTQA